MKTRGMGSIRRRGGMWWIFLNKAGRKIRFSTGVPVVPGKGPPAEVKRQWLERLNQLGRGNAAALESRAPTFEDLKSALLTRYAAENRRHALRNATLRLRHLEEAFGGWKLSEINEEAILAYAVKRRDRDGASVDTVNLSLSYLRRGFRLLHKRLPSLPEIKHLPGARSRQGTVSSNQLTDMVAKLGPFHGAVATFLRLTGWRCAEGLSLEWRRVDWREKLIRLETSKSGEPRVFAFGRYRRLEALLRLQRMRQRASGLAIPYVFHGPSGKAISADEFRSRWTRVRTSLGYTCRIHDLRRTRVVELERAGVPLTVGMSSVGMSSVQIYRRYGVVTPQEQAQWMDCGEPQEKVARFKERKWGEKA